MSVQGGSAPSGPAALVVRGPSWGRCGGREGGWLSLMCLVHVQELGVQYSPE